MSIKKDINKFYDAYLNDTTRYGGDFVKKLYNAFDSDYNDNFNYEYILDDECKDYDKLVKRNNILFYISKNIYKVNSTKFSRDKYIENFYKNVDDFTSIFDYNNNKNIILFKFLFIYTYIILFWTNYYTTNYHTFKDKKKIEFKTLFKEFLKSNNNIFNSLKKEYKSYKKDKDKSIYKRFYINDYHPNDKNIVSEKKDFFDEIEILKCKNKNIKEEIIEKIKQEKQEKIKQKEREENIKEIKIKNVSINNYDLKNIQKYLNETINKYCNDVNLKDDIITIDNENNKYEITFNIEKIYYLTYIKLYIKFIIHICDNNYFIIDLNNNDNKIYNNDLFLNNFKYYEFNDNEDENINFINIFYKYIIFICTNKYINDNTKININNISKYSDFINYDNLKTDICKFKNYKKNVINKSIIYFINIFNKIKEKEEKKEKYIKAEDDFKLYNIDIDKNSNCSNNEKYCYIYKILIIDYYIEKYIYRRYNYYNNNIIDSKYIKK
jgi:hypothetical protein|tara:strand:+ start:2290 stop:3774 length:1485 start_codon:yes stop_codon:yes gene_type:complete